MLQRTGSGRRTAGSERWADSARRRTDAAQRDTLHFSHFTVAAVCLLPFLCGASLAGLAQRIQKIIPSQAGEDYSIHIVAPDSGAVLYSCRARKPLIPASNMKLVTTAAALKYLGPRFEYKTSVGLCGPTLVVVGSGDPLLGDKETDDRYSRPSGWVLEKIAQAVQNRGIREITDVVVDTTVFDDQRVHPGWPAADLNRWYACEVCGLNYNDNCIELTTSNDGGTVTVAMEPRTGFVEMTNNVQPTSGDDSAVGSYRTQTPNKIIVFGKCRTREGPFKVAIEQPAAFFGCLVAEHLAGAGIAVKGKVIEKGIDKADPYRPLVKFTTPLADVLRRANTDSLSLAAEALLKTIDAWNNPDYKGGGWTGGRERLARYLSSLGIPSEEYVIDDGSGLSRENRLTTNAITKVLLDLYRGGNWELFRDSLAVGGEEGTVGRYFNEPRYRGKILGKTGYISGVRAFSGVCLTDSGPYLFSIITNGPKSLSRDTINDIAKAVMDEYSDDAKAK
jgi:D-alanyl-D-alanine carboxypeptidase/D-alanyl-D-alanine-endopeptidase (penicillin-binding protein 4)